MIQSEEAAPAVDSCSLFDGERVTLADVRLHVVLAVLVVPRAGVAHLAAVLAAEALVVVRLATVPELGVARHRRELDAAGREELLEPRQQGPARRGGEVLDEPPVDADVERARGLSRSPIARRCT